MENLINKEKPVISFKTGLILTLTIILVYTIISIGFMGNEEFLRVFGDLISIFIIFSMTLIIAFNVHFFHQRSDPNYRMWILFLLSLVSYLIGDITWAILELGFNQNPFPSIADIFYIAYYPLFALGLFFIPRAYNQAHRGYRLMLDVAIVLIALLMFFWIFLIIPLLETVPADPTGAVISIVYIILDLVLLFALLDLMFDKIRSLKDLTLILLALAVSIQIISDAIYSFQNLQGTYISGGMLDLGWISSYLFLGLASIWEANKKVVFRKDGKASFDENRRFTWTYYLPIFLVLASYLLLSLGYQNLSYWDWIFLDIGVGITIILVIIRQIISLNDNRILYTKAQAEIGKRKEIEKNLKIERDRAQSYFNISKVIMLVLDRKGNIQLINKKGCEILGYDKNEIIGKNWFENFIPSEIKEKSQNMFQECMKGRDIEEFENIESIILTKKNEIKTILWYNTILKDEDGNITGILSSGEDISQQKLMDKIKKKRIKDIIRRQEAILQLIREESDDLERAFQNISRMDAQTLEVERVSIWFFNLEKTEISCQVLYKRSQDSYESGEVLKVSDYPNYFKEILKGQNLAVEDALHDPITHEFATDYLKPNNIVSMLDIPIWHRGEIYGILCHEVVGEELRIWDLEDQEFTTSISNIISRALESEERRQAEASIRDSLQEKELLLREIHHRVKNNMQIISSLLNLQTLYVEGEETLSVLKESQGRVKSMAMIHEKLYQSHDLSHINLGSYITKLVSDLFDTYGVKNGSITPEIKVSDIQISLETAIPCGLIVNELVTNSLKYAFEEKKTGHINIEFKQEDDDYVLIISDDGSGIPEDIDFRNTRSLGLQLVNNLVKQIDGNIELDRNQGTKFIIRFQDVEYKKRISK